MFRRLYRLDDRALNAWWGLFVTPFPWLTYRLGYRFGKRGRDSSRAIVFFPGGASRLIYERGAREGRPLRRRR